MKKIFILVCILASVLFAKGAEFDALMNDLAKEAKGGNSSFGGFSKNRGEQIFYAELLDKNGQKISCTTCHQIDIRQKGKNPTTGKVIDPLAPSITPSRLSDRAEIEKWLKRNFKQVYGREGTPLEKGDVLMFISSK